MEEDINKEVTLIPESDQPEAGAVTIASETGSETIHANQADQHMEVHHHPDLQHKPKKLKEYFLEFIMIFLAVTMGFVAENIRDHITEHKNAQILAQSLLEDIKKDTASLHSLVGFGIKKFAAADTLLGILHTPQNNWNTGNFYANLGPIMTSLPFESTDGTYTQMKTSGTLKFFNQSLINIINSYDVQLKKTQYRDDVENKGIWVLADIIINIVNFEVFTDIRLKRPITHDMYVKINNQETIDKLINLITMNNQFIARSLQEYKVQLTIADKLIEAIKKEYGLD